LVGPDSWWHWHSDLYSGLLLLVGVYAMAIGPLRGYIAPKSVNAPSISQVGCFLLGCVAMLFALAGPIHELSDEYLFSAHMAQHIILTLLVPPLLLLGTPGWLIRPLVKPKLIFKVMIFASKPLTAFIIFNVMFVTWHFPIFYEGALNNHLLHILEHLLFMATSVIVWWPVLSPLHEIPRSSYPIQVLYLVMLTISQTPLFAVITFSTGVIYDFYDMAPRMWGISSLADQQIGGIIMKLSWILVFLPTICIVFIRWYHEDSQMESK